MKPVRFDYVAARDSAEAVQLLRQHGDEAKCIAGGQSLGPMLNLRLARPSVLVDLHRAEDLRLTEQRSDSIVYGSTQRHAEFEDGLVPDATNGLLRTVASRLAYRAIRNRGTLGGSIAHADPAADWIGVMVGLDATYRLLGADGLREVSSTEFMSAAFMTRLGAGEILCGISVPRLSKAARWGYYRYSRKSSGFSEATGIVVADPERGYCRVVLGALDIPPVALEQVANALAEKGVDEAIACTGEAVNEMLAGYSDAKRQLFTVVVRRALEQIGEKQ
ncbi:MAG: FAD binding domain-containing protein [Saccharospirillum sp.]|nr:FAD binding domain-containing protein [Saccharospirillum sp.]